MPQSKRTKKIFSVLGKDRKQKRDLDVTSPPPEATFITRDKQEALNHVKEFKTKYNSVRLLEKRI